MREKKHTVFHRFGQAKFADGGWLDLRLKLIITTVWAAYKNDAQFKSSQNWLIHLASLI